ncbi:Scr1 family TA system antitoxin-like transcriptional regulator [Streptomyces sp. NPDC058625]|uniref:Scr1 family TA system antitoxin-like transcriptional regulator n=1 Tax=Streptomyces sp. NPDC058625 TaxID=3346564 RepID=UPI00365A05B2
MVLRRPLGGREVHKGQLGRLLGLGRLRTVELPVMPTDRLEHPGMGGSLTLLTPKGKSQVAYTEVQTSARSAAELDEVRIPAARCGGIRAQALTPRESPTPVERMQTEDEC